MSAYIHVSARMGVTRRATDSALLRKPHWHGAHGKRLEQIIDSAVRAASPSENR
jgi:hypothetical protein